VAIGSSDGKVVISAVSQSAVTEQVCARLHRDLTDEERIAYGLEDAAPVCP
jgi:hypothetical protein